MKRESKGGFLTPYDSDGTKDMETKKSQGAVHGVEDHKETPDPLGYLKADSRGD